MAKCAVVSTELKYIVEPDTLRYEDPDEKLFEMYWLWNKGFDLILHYLFLPYTVCCAAYSKRDYQVIADVTLNCGVLAATVLHEQFLVLRERLSQRSGALHFVSLIVSG